MFLTREKTLLTLFWPRLSYRPIYKWYSLERKCFNDKLDAIEGDSNLDHLSIWLFNVYFLTSYVEKKERKMLYLSTFQFCFSMTMKNVLRCAKCWQNNWSFNETNLKIISLIIGAWYWIKTRKISEFLFACFWGNKTVNHIKHNVFAVKMSLTILFIFFFFFAFIVRIAKGFLPAKWMLWFLGIVFALAY